MPSLPSHPDIRHLRLQAKTLLKSARSGEEDAVERIRSATGARRDRVVLSDAYHAIAREHGFKSWPHLKIHLEIAAGNLEEKREMFLSSAWLWGDRKRAEAVLESSPELTRGDIHAACAAGDLDAVTDMLATDPTAATTKGGPRDWTPILHATWSCYLTERADAMVRILELLLRHGADPDSYWVNDDDWKESALYGCVENNCVPAARVLVDAGADPNDNESLYHACEKFNLELLDTVAANGLDAEAVSYCIKHVMDMNWTEGIRWFLDQGADPNAIHPADGETSLHWAVKRNNTVEVIGTLLEAGADPNARTSTGKSTALGIVGWTPLDFAHRLGRRDVAERLRQHGAEPSPTSEYDRFVIACANTDLEVVQRLRSRHLNQLSDDDKTLISHAAQVDNWAAVRLMADLGWPIDARGWMEATPLYWALCKGHSEMVDFLLRLGASTEPIGGYFQDPVHAVMHCQWNRDNGGYPAALGLLLDHGLGVPEGRYPSGNAAMDAVLAQYIED